MDIHCGSLNALSDNQKAIIKHYKNIMVIDIHGIDIIHLLFIIILGVRISDYTSV